MANNNELEKKDIYLGQTTIEQVQHIDDNFTQLFNKDDTNDERFEAIESNVTTNQTNIAKITTEAGTDIVLTLNNTDYKMTLQLKNLAGTVVSTQEIDFPIESMVVNATYDNTTKKITLTLQNGNTIDVSVADLISGLVPDTRTINGHPLSSDITITQDDLDINVAKHSQTLLSNVDLNTLYGDDKVGWYYGKYLHGCSNTPAGVNDFSLEVAKAGDALYAQTFYSVAGDGYIYRRYISGSSKPGWTRFASVEDLPTSVNGLKGGKINGDTTIDGVLNVTGTDLTLNSDGEGANFHYDIDSGNLSFNGVNIITTEDLDDTKHSCKKLAYEDLDTLNTTAYVGWYYAETGNTCTNIPSELSSGTGFGLEVGLCGDIAYEGENTIVYQKLIPQKKQTLISRVNCDVYYRSMGTYPSGSTVLVDWGKWTKLADTSIATKSKDGLMSLTDKGRLDSLYEGYRKYVVRRTQDVNKNDSEWETFTVNGTTYYGHPVDLFSEFYDITGVYNNDGYGIIYQEYRYNSQKWVLVSSKMSMKICYIDEYVNPHT